jgi:hypothetical protein
MTWAKTRDPIQKIAQSKKGWGIAEAAEHLTNKPEALSSNPSTTNKNKK